MDGLQLLAALRVNKLMRGLQDRRGIPQALTELARTPVVPASNGEIMARFVGQVLIADLIADGQRAGVYSAGKFAIEATTAPNLKVGTALNQDQIDQFEAYASNVQSDDPLYLSSESRIIDNLRTGVSQRMEALIVAAKIGGFSYDRLGIKMSNVNFGMPADLKITVANEWTDHTNATPVADINFARRVGRVKYGIEYDRLKMTGAAFDEMIACTEFQNKARTFLAPNTSFVNLDLSNTDAMVNLARNVIGIKEIEIKDNRYWTEDPDAGLRSAPFLPINKVVLESTQSDNDASVIDFANGVVTESVISRAGGSKINGQIPRGARGPVGYTTTEDNPPAIMYWGVGKGFARRHYQQATACLTVAPDSGTGAIEETIDFEEIAFS